MPKLFGDVKPGDRLFRAKRGHRQNDPLQTDWVVVTKVGRKWVEFQPESAKSPGKWTLGRFDNESGRLDMEFGPGGSVHRSEEAFHAHEGAKETWRKFNEAMRYRDLPIGVTAADILTAAELLKLEWKR